MSIKEKIDELEARMEGLGHQMNEAVTFLKGFVEQNASVCERCNKLGPTEVFHVVADIHHQLCCSCINASVVDDDLSYARKRLRIEECHLRSHLTQACNKSLVAKLIDQVEEAREKARRDLELWMNPRPKTSLIRINGLVEEIEDPRPTITYEEVCELADFDPKGLPSVTHRYPDKVDKRPGIMTPGSAVELVEGMSFEVY